jgi:hypothetical protein
MKANFRKGVSSLYGNLRDLVEAIERGNVELYVQQIW